MRRGIRRPMERHGREAARRSKATRSKTVLRRRETRSERDSWCPVFLPKIQPIGEIAVIEPAIGGLRQNGRNSAGMQKDAGENYGREYDVIQRKNAKDTAGIEAAEIVCGGAGIEEDAGDEKSGEDEEEIDAGPAEAKIVLQDGAREMVGRDIGAHVQEEDKNDGAGAETVEFRDESGLR